MEIFTISGIWERGCIKPKPVLLLSETGFAFLEIDKETLTDEFRDIYKGK